MQSFLSITDYDYKSIQLETMSKCVHDQQVFASNDDADKTNDKHQPSDCASLR